MIEPIVKSPLEIYYANSWFDRDTKEWHPDVRTISHTTAGASKLADQHTGLSPYQRRRRGFRIMPYRLTFVPGWTEEETNVVPIRETVRS